MRAAHIADPAHRADATASLDRERLNLQGAALMSVLASTVDRDLVRLLVAYQVILDYLDTVGERLAAERGEALQVSAALIEALDPSRPCISQLDDGGYLSSIVAVCRRQCARLPRYAEVQELALLHAERLQVQDVNHEPQPAVRRVALREWMASQLQIEVGSVSWDLVAASSSTLAILALLAVANDRETTHDEIASINAAYFPAINALSTFLDSYVDLAEDRLTGGQNFLSAYPSLYDAVDRIRTLVEESMARARALPRGERHAVIVSGMVAMYLSHASARSPELRAYSAEISRAAGPLQLVQLPVMRIFRAAHGLRNA